MASSDEAHKACTQKPCVLLTFFPPPYFPDLLPALEERFTLIHSYVDPAGYRHRDGSDNTGQCNGDGDDDAWKRPLALHAACVRALIGVRVSTELLDSLPNLRLIVCPVVGFDTIDLATCRSRGVAVTNIPDVSSDDIADLAILLMLAAVRRLCPADRYVRSGLWPLHGAYPLTNKWLIRLLGIRADACDVNFCAEVTEYNAPASGRKIGIVGLGSIGMCIARRAEGFGCKISYYGRSRKPTVTYTYYSDLEKLATDSDVLFVSCSLTPKTRHMIGKRILDALGPQGTLVNIARGPIVNGAELGIALKSGHLGTAALDVYENEPNVPKELLALENVVLTPHMGSGTIETRRIMGQITVKNLEAWFSGKPLESRIV